MQVVLTIIRFILGFIGVILAVFTALGIIVSFEGGLSGDEISLIVFFGILTFLTLGYSITLGENSRRGRTIIVQQDKINELEDLKEQVNIIDLESTKIK